MVIGSIPRMSKTFSVRLLLLAAALDVLAELHVFDLKGHRRLLRPGAGGARLTCR
jgi:hypothetical protein